jgi:DNA topoisomerase-3
VGRVQTPVLGLIVRRDLAIEAFTSKPFYTLKARVEVQGGAFDAHWAPGDAAEGYLDDDNRVIDRQYAASLAQALTAGHGDIISVQVRHKKEAPPLPFSLPELQKVAAKGRGLSPKKTLALAQSLYEKHQVLTYPRSDCSYLPLDHWNEAAEVRDAVSQSIGESHALAPMADEVDLIHRGKCWNDEKITAHHAIIPTKKWVPLDKLTADERWLYEQVAHRYLLQFCVDREYDQTDVRLQVAGGEAKEQFKARGRVAIRPGWAIYKAVLSSTSAGSQEDKDDPETQSTTELPALSNGEALVCPTCELVEKETTPPKRFTEATLLDAMTGIARFVQDPAIKQTLKETDGLGTPATQATIIDTLFRRGYLEKRKKLVYSTTLGREMIKILPEPVTLPDMTARWEQQLAQVENGGLSLDSFMTGVVTYTRQLVGEGKAGGALVLEGAPPKTKKTPAPTVHHACPGEGCDGRLRRIKGKKGFFWGCTKYGEGCKETRPDSRGKPASAVKARTSGTARQRKVSQPVAIGAKCPECRKGLIQLKALKTGNNAGKSFNGCTNYPACRYFAWPDSDSKRKASA